MKICSLLESKSLSVVRTDPRNVKQDSLEMRFDASKTNTSSFEAFLISSAVSVLNRGAKNE